MYPQGYDLSFLNETEQERSFLRRQELYLRLRDELKESVSSVLEKFEAMGFIDEQFKGGMFPTSDITTLGIADDTFDHIEGNYLLPPDDCIN